MDFHGALQEAPHQRLFANTRHTNVYMCVTELLCLCLGGSETYGANVVISEGGRRFSTIAWLCFVFVLDPVIFPCNGCEKASEIGFLWWNRRWRGMILGWMKAAKHVLCFSDQHKILLHLMEPYSFIPAIPLSPKKPFGIHQLLASLHPNSALPHLCVSFHRIYNFIPLQLVSIQQGSVTVFSYQIILCP